MIEVNLEITLGLAGWLAAGVAGGRMLRRNRPLAPGGLFAAAALGLFSVAAALVARRQGRG